MAVRARISSLPIFWMSVGLCFATTSAWAQTQGYGHGADIVRPKEESPAPPPPALTAITLPVLKQDPGAVYPEAALQEGVRDTITVVVIVTVDIAGHVKDARVETAQGHGFDEAALAAAQKLEFTPATKNANPISARIKHQYVFSPPTGRIVTTIRDRATNKPLANALISLKKDGLVVANAQSDATGVARLTDLLFGNYHIEISAPGFVAGSVDDELAPGQEVANIVRLDADAAATATEAPKATPKNQDDVEDVTVHGNKPAREVTKRTIEQRELLRIPGSNGDALRSLQNLPGVARPPGLAGLLVIRGSAPQDTQIFVDGTPIPIVYHFGGLSSVVPTEMLDRIDFYPGNFSAQYGRAMGGIVDVAMRDPNQEKLHGLAQVDLIDARVMAEGPLGKGWSFSIAGRRSWVDAWLKPVLEQTGAGVTAAPVYYDYQAMLEKRFDKNQSFRLLFFGSNDNLDILIKDANASDPSADGNIGLHTGFWRLQGLYRNKLSSGTEIKLNAAVGEDILDLSVGDIFFKVASYPITGRAEVSQKIAPGIVGNVGLDLIDTPYSVNARLPPLPRPGQPPGGPGLSVAPLNSQQTGVLYRPGVYGEFELTPFHGTRIVPGVRLDYAKDTRNFDLAPRVVVRQDIGPTFPRTTLKGGAGIFYQPPQPQETAAVFGQQGLVSNRAIQYSAGAEREFTKNLEVSLEGFYKQLDHLVTGGNLNEGRGRVYGLETLIRYKPDAHFFGWIAYTLSRSERQDTPQDAVRLAAFDQTHILTILGSYRLGRGWEVGARFRLVSGNLYTPRAYGFYDANAGSYLPLNTYPPNGSRLPLFHQLDLRVDKTWKFKAWQFGIYADVQNVYNNANVEGVGYNYNYTLQNYTTGLPILPSLGMRGEF